MLSHGDPQLRGRTELWDWKARERPRTVSDRVFVQSLRLYQRFCLHHRMLGDLGRRHWFLRTANEWKNPHIVLRVSSSDVTIPMGKRRRPTSPPLEMSPSLFLGSCASLGSCDCAFPCEHCEAGVRITCWSIFRERCSAECKRWEPFLMQRPAKRHEIDPIGRVAGWFAIGDKNLSATKN